MRPQAVAVRVLNGIERGAWQVIEPPLVRTVPPLRALPPRVFDAVADFFGIDRTMNELVGREGDRA